MKKIFKATLAVAAIAAVGMGSFRAFESYIVSNEIKNDLISENVLALAESNTYIKGYKEGNVLKCKSVAVGIPPSLQLQFVLVKCCVSASEMSACCFAMQDPDC